MSNETNPNFLRRIRSFVKREGRLTPGQDSAIKTSWPLYGLDPAVLIEPDSLFGNNHPITLEIGFGNGESLTTMAENNPGRNFIGIGTCEEYYKKNFKKNFFIENNNIKPTNIYSRAKNFFHLYLKKSGINYKWVRIFYLFGEGENKKRLFPSLIESVIKNKKFKLKNPNFRTDFLYVDTVVKMIDKLINLKVSGEFNVCRGKSEKLEDIYNFIIKYFRIDLTKNRNKTNNKLNKEEIVGSTKKMKKYKCYVHSNFEYNLIKYLRLFKNSRP